MKQLLYDAIAFSSQNAIGFHFNQKNKRHVYAVGIYCSIVELSRSFLSLVNSKNYTGCLSVYRTFLESYVDLKNIKIDERYIEQLDYANLDSIKRNLESSKNGNAYLKPLIKHADERLPELLSEIKQLKSEMSCKPMRISEKFKKVDMENEYYGLYPKLCAEAHCSVSAILARHIEFNEKNNSIKVVIFQEKPDHKHDFYLCNMAQQLIDSGALLCEILHDSRVQSFILKKDTIRKELSSCL